MYQFTNGEFVSKIKFKLNHVLFFLDMIYIVIISLFLLIELNFSQCNQVFNLIGKLLLMGEIYSMSGGNWSDKRQNKNQGRSILFY